MKTKSPSPDSSGNPYESRFFNETHKIVTDSRTRAKRTDEVNSS
jgi:hypothetical protein